MFARLDTTEWRLAACKGLASDDLFPDDPEDRSAILAYCNYCQIRELCLNSALESGSRDGVWGGLTELERAHLHDQYEHKLTIVPVPSTRKPERDLTNDERVELVDLGVGSTRAARRNFRMRIGELYQDGARRRDLEQATGKYARYIDRALAEYRRYHKIPVDQRVHKPKTRLALKRRERRALDNYRAMAKLAPTQVARDFWASKADEYAASKRVVLPLN